MIAQKQASLFTMFCRQCGYQLTGLSEHRCPECGQTFDPTNRRTYLRHPRGWLLRRWLRRILCVFLALLLIASLVAARIGWLYWNWRSDQPLVATIRQAGADPHWLYLQSYLEPFLPVDWRSGTNHPYMLERPVGIHFLNHKHGVDAAMARMPSHPQLRTIMLSETDISDEGLRVLKNWPQAKDLSLGKQITDAGLAYVCDLTNLEVLGLSQTKVSDAGLANLRNLTRLRELFLSDTQITDAGMQYVGQLPALRWLWLNNTAVGDEGVVALAKASTLDTLVMQGTKVTDAGLVHLRALRRLRQLILANTKVTDAGMAALAQVPSLERVTLSGTGVTDVGLALLVQAPAIQYVNVKGTPVTPGTVERLKRSRSDLEIEGP